MEVVRLLPTAPIKFRLQQSGLCDRGLEPIKFRLQQSGLCDRGLERKFRLQQSGLCDRGLERVDRLQGRGAVLAPHAREPPVVLQIAEGDVRTCSCGRLRLYQKNCRRRRGDRRGNQGRRQRHPVLSPRFVVECDHFRWAGGAALLISQHLPNCGEGIRILGSFVGVARVELFPAPVIQLERGVDL